MPASLEEVEALFEAVKLLRAERRKMQKLSDKCRDMEIGKAHRRATADLNFQAHYCVRLEHKVHAAAVDCGVADLRTAEHYRPYKASVDAWRDYEVVPAKPKSFREDAA